MSEQPTQTAPPAELPPLEPGVMGNWRFDLLSGFLVFLIAMPLSLAIAQASGFPPIAGIWTAVIGGVVTCFLSNAELTIKGPAAGLIVIVAGAVTELGNEFGHGLSDGERAMVGYRLALGIGVASGIIQVLFGLLRAGRLADFFPLTPVHGMLASIGLIIIGKQFYAVMGTTAEKGAEPLHLLMGMPGAIARANPEIAIIGVVSLVILFGLPLFRYDWGKKIPAPLLVVAIAIGLGMWFDLDHKHTYLFPNSFFSSESYSEHEIGPRFLVDMPGVLKKPSSAFAFPDFRGLATTVGLQYLLLFSLIGSLESLLSAKAVELLDPWKRKTNFDRDLLAVGLANTLVALIGGLPMISEIVRSSANINAGGRTRKANLFHGLFLLGFVLLLPDLIHQIPLAALGAMLVFTGFRLASPKEFLRTYRVGSEQFIVFIGTILTTLATDLLIGIVAGIGIKVAFHLWHGAPARSLFRCKVDVVPEGDETVILVVRDSAVFTNWLWLRAAIIEQASTYKNTVLDLSHTRLVDHSVMEKLHELESDFQQQGKTLSLIGLDEHKPLSGHPHAARRRTAAVA